jgi:hypothetical protein
MSDRFEFQAWFRALPPVERKEMLAVMEEFAAKMQAQRVKMGLAPGEEIEGLEVVAEGAPEVCAEGAKLAGLVAYALAHEPGLLGEG